MICRDCLIQFQFQYGTIKTCDGQYVRIYTFIFQFHDGTIKTVLTYIAQAFCVGFQFHDGTIKTKKYIDKILFLRISIP